jgi:hypothetical protein
MLCLRVLAVLMLMVVPALATELTREQVTQDLQFFRDVWASKDRSYTPISRSRMLAFIDGRIKNARPMEKAELALVFAEAASFSENNHTLAEIYNAKDVFHSLPISFWWFPEGAIVTRAHPQFRRTAGCQDSFDWKCSRRASSCKN